MEILIDVPHYQRKAQGDPSQKQQSRRKLIISPAVSDLILLKNTASVAKKAIVNMERETATARISRLFRSSILCASLNA